MSASTSFFLLRSGAPVTEVPHPSTPAGNAGPIQPDAQQGDKAAAPTDRNRPGKGITVLLVEARTLVRQGINALLANKDDITVIGQASDCDQAFALAEKLRPDVAILSFSLALRDGLEFIIRRMFEAGSGTRVLVLMPHSDNQGLIDQATISGTAGCVTEQAGAHLLASAVREVHGKNKLSVREILPPASRPALTTREVEVLHLIAGGNANKQTAAKLGISVKTVEKHRQHVMTKLGIHETATLTRFAVYAGIA
jgi:DNA-binding NarL/FixJ family response regulator